MGVKAISRKELKRRLLRCGGVSPDDTENAAVLELLERVEGLEAQDEIDRLRGKDAEIARLRRALISLQIEAGTHLFNRMRGIEMNSRLLDDLERRTDSREECYRLRRALDLLGVPAQALRDPNKATPLRITVDKAQEAMGWTTGKLRGEE